MRVAECEMSLCGAGEEKDIEVDPTEKAGSSAEGGDVLWEEEGS